MPDQTADELFDLPPEEFTAARDALTKALRAEGRKDDAKDVKALRRPTVAAWAVNLVARRHPGRLDDAAALARELEAAQRQLLSGVRGADLGALTRRRKELVADLVALAAREAGRDLGAAGEEVRATFDAVVMDADAAEVVRAGRLKRPLPPPSGFGTLAGLSSVPGGAPAPRSAPAAEPGPGADADPIAASGAEDDDAEEAARAEALALARREAARAREAVDAANAAARDAERTADQRRRTADEAAAEAQRLRRDADAAARRAERAGRGADDAAHAAAEAEARAGRARDRADERRRLLADLESSLEAVEAAVQR